jgi:rubrerythrin
MSQAELEHFLSTDDLCNKDFRETMDLMIDTEHRVATLLEQDIEEYLYFTRRFSRRDVHRRLVAPESRATEIAKRLKTRMEATARRAQELDKSLPDLEQKIKAFNSNLEVLDPIVQLICPKCSMPIVKQPARRPDNGSRLVRFSWELLKGELKRPVKCACCENIITRQKAKRTHLHVVKESVRILWESNLWLEDYISRLLRSLDWQTWPHVHVLGSSGVRHEIDVLGVKGSYVLVCECKTGRVSRQDVPNFWAKVYDIRSHVGMLALIHELPEAETKEFVAKNPSVVLLEKLGEKGKSQILGELRAGMLSKI